MSVATLYTRMMANARSRVPGALDDVMKHELFSALDEFFQKSEIWREEVEVPIVADEDEYEVEPDATSASITRLYSLVDENDTSVPATMSEIGLLVLNTVPVAAATLTAKLILKPSEPLLVTGYPNCPEWILERYWLPIVDGLLSRMMSMPMKPYTNAVLAAYHGRLFRNGIAQANADVRTGNLYNGQAWTFPRFA